VREAMTSRRINLSKKEAKNVIAKECHYQFTLGHAFGTKSIAQLLPSQANSEAAKKIATLMLDVYADFL
jgi:hypothetical protein